MSRSPHTRRRFLQELAAGLAVAPFLSRRSIAEAPSKKLRHASFGTSGMAFSDVTSLASHASIEVVAGCDVDERSTAKFREKFPEARIYRDFRELLAKETDLQTVNVSTPDHMHAPIAMSCLQRGLHVYGQKPLTHSIYEARRLTEVAREKKLVTQMGIQIHSAREYRSAVKAVQAGAIGKVKEVHAWSGKEWGDIAEMPTSSDSVPEGLDWDQWLGVRAERPFIGNGWYHPGSWRKRLDFGTGTLGDMGCHIYDPVFAALELTAPISVQSDGPAPNAHSWPMQSIIRYVYPRTAHTEGETLQVVWYDGAQRPPEEVQALAMEPAEGQASPKKLPEQGSIFIGTEGVMLLPHVGMPQFRGKAIDSAKTEPAEGQNHYHQFVEAVLGNGTPSANFDYAGPLTEAVLLGTVAMRFPQTKLAWDAGQMRFTNVEAANEHVRRAYRSGWEIPGLS